MISEQEAGEAGENAAVQIAPQLYQELREFCDQVGVRFADFIADALETSRERYRTDEQLREMRDLARRIEEVRREGFRRGWRHGVWLGFWAARGDLGLGLEGRVPEAGGVETEFRPVSGGQMGLFDG